MNETCPRCGHWVAVQMNPAEPGQGFGIARAFCKDVRVCSWKSGWIPMRPGFETYLEWMVGNLHISTAGQTTAGRN